MPHCVVCEGIRTTPAFEKFSLQMWHCRSCDALFTYPLPPPAQIEGRYSRDWFEREYLPSYGIDPHHPSLEHLATRFSQELALVAPFREVGRILDVGAGAGLFLSQAKQRGWEVHGVELSEFGPQYARQHFGIEIQRGTLEQVRLPDQHFDVVMLQDTIEHVPAPLTLMREIHRIVRPGGAVVLSTPNLASLGRKIAGRHWALISPSEHLCLCTPRTLHTLLANSGFDTHELHTTASVSAGLLHEGQGWAYRIRRKMLRAVVRRVTPAQLTRWKLGDELHAVGVRRVEERGA